ncbi:MAG: helix-turn-helix domain-containing protein [Paracoccaceae bacterium]
MAKYKLAYNSQESKNNKPKGFDDFELKLGDTLRGERATLGKSVVEVQNELKIKAAYISAIENCDPVAFDTPGFVAGYVRSYARYLNLDPDEVFTKFCSESGFATVHGMSNKASSVKPNSNSALLPSDNFIDGEELFNKSPTAILDNSSKTFDKIEPGAIGSLVALICIVCGIGYGGLTLFNQMQTVKISPSDASPVVLTEISSELLREDINSFTTSKIKSDQLDRLYRPQALEVPVLTARDGPISTLDPSFSNNFDVTGNLNISDIATNGSEKKLIKQVISNDLELASIQVVQDLPPSVAVLVTENAWVQITGSDGTVIYENIMLPGEEFVLPQLELPPKLRAGMSGYVYFSVDGELFGPVGSGTSVRKNVELSATNITSTLQTPELSNKKLIAELISKGNFPSLQKFNLD